MRIIKDNTGIMTNEVELAVWLLSGRNKKPIHKVDIQCRSVKNLDTIHNQIFEVVKGKYEPNEMGKKFGAFITASSFTIGFNTTNLKDLAECLGINTVRIIRYKTL